MRGVTLADMSESTKISRRWLQALEDEEFGVLPGGVFNRGFVRAYAHFLGINEEEAVEDYIAASHEQAPPEDKFPLDIHEKPEARRMNPKKSRIPALLAALALVLLIGWTYWTRYKSNVFPWFSSRSQVTNTSQATTASGSTQDQQAADAAGSAPADEEAQGNGTRELHINARKSSNRKDMGGSFSVVIKARETSWISIAADGKTLWEGTLSANNERAVSADKELILKTGNAAGIEVSYNGKDLGALGKDREVRTLTFNTAGLQQ